MWDCGKPLNTGKEGEAVRQRHRDQKAKDDYHYCQLQRRGWEDDHRYASGLLFPDAGTDLAGGCGLEPFGSRLVGNGKYPNQGRDGGASG